MDQDQLEVHVSSRRAMLAALSAAGSVFLLGLWRPFSPKAQARETAAAIPGCVVRPAQTEGPYFVDTRLNRQDIRSDPTDGSVKPGVPLQLALRVSRVDGATCAPLAGAMVDIWHCDASGIYSDAHDPQFDTRGRQYLRGFQITDAGGEVRFTTIYPGWYAGRTVHVHFKIRVGEPGARPREFTSQLYFDDAITDRVLAQAPYRVDTKRRDRNAGDGIYRRGGEQLLLALRPEGAGYAASFDIGLRPG